MEQTLTQRILKKIGLAILIIAAVDLIFLNYLVIKNQQPKPKIPQNQSQPENTESTPLILPSPAASPSSTQLQAKPTPAPTSQVQTIETKTIVEKQTQTIVQTAQKEIFIPVGSGSTFKDSYTDLAGLEVTIDTNKYSAIESVVFEASIWVQDGNGKMYTQLYNKTDAHPVWSSEISTSSASGTLTTSPKITLDSGSKTYKVQAKTNLTSYAAHVENARIKIVLK